MSGRHSSSGPVSCASRSPVARSLARVRKAPVVGPLIAFGTSMSISLAYLVQQLSKKSTAGSVAGYAVRSDCAYVTESELEASV
jgi:hypothetical protein